jgi:hypothetical protein
MQGESPLRPDATESELHLWARNMQLLSHGVSIMRYGQSGAVRPAPPNIFVQQTLLFAYGDTMEAICN